MVGVEVGDEDRPHAAAGPGPKPLVDGEPGPPQLAVHALAAVDEVGGVADDDGVGVPAPPRLRVRRRRRCRAARGACAASARRGAARPSVDGRHGWANASRRHQANLTCRARVGNVCRPGSPVAASARGSRSRPSNRGIDVTTTDEVVFPTPDEIEGFWALDKMHAPRPITPLSFDLVVRTAGRGIHQGAGGVRLPDHGDDEGDQPLLLRRLPPDPRRGRDPAADGQLPRQAGGQGPR